MDNNIQTKITLGVAERYNLLAIIDKQAALALAREALEAVEWREVNVWSFCPWCMRGHLISSSDESHSDDCLRQRALEAIVMTEKRDEPG